MSCCDNGFSSFKDFDNKDFITELHYGIKAFLDMGFLGIGAWEDVFSGSENCDANLYTLTKITLPVTRPYYIWASPKKHWVWEEVTYDSGSPQEPIIYLNGVDRTNQCEINYTLGQIKTTYNATTGSATYSYKKVQVYTEDDSVWWRTLIDCIEGDDTNKLADLLSQNKVQPPAIVLETGSTRARPLQMGSTATIINQQIIFNIIADSPQMRNKLVAILNGQNAYSFNILNTDEAPLPLNCDGTKNSTIQYDDLPSWKCVRIRNIGSSLYEKPSNSIFIARIMIDFEIQHPFKPKNDV